RPPRLSVARLADRERPKPLEFLQDPAEAIHAVIDAGAPQRVPMCSKNACSVLSGRSLMVERPTWLVTPRGRIASHSGCTVVPQPRLCGGGEGVGGRGHEPSGAQFGRRNDNADPLAISQSVRHGRSPKVV